MTSPIASANHPKWRVCLLFWPSNSGICFVFEQVDLGCLIFWQTHALQCSFQKKLQLGNKQKATVVGHMFQSRPVQQLNKNPCFRTCWRHGLHESASSTFAPRAWFCGETFNVTSHFFQLWESHISVDPVYDGQVQFFILEDSIPLAFNIFGVE